eukprot:UN19266
MVCPVKIAKIHPHKVVFHYLPNQRVEKILAGRFTNIVRPLIIIATKLNTKVELRDLFIDIANDIDR